MGEPQVLVVGSTMIDMITYVPRTPAAGETIAGEVFQLGFGGKGANQAVMARHLGAEVGIVNCVGDDVFGEMTVANFREQGVRTDQLVTVSGVASGVAPIWVEPDGTNRIVVVPGANERMSAEQAKTAVREARGLDLVLSQFEIPHAVTSAAFRAARARGATTVLNPAPAERIEPELLAVTDWVVPNETELLTVARAAGESVDSRVSTNAMIDDGLLAAAAGALGVRLVTTLGEHGAAVCDTSGRVHRIRTPQVPIVVDTTGAGDAFVGAFSYGLAAGMDEFEAARLGCACASASVTAQGTQKSFPTGESLATLRRAAQRSAPGTHD